MNEEDLKQTDHPINEPIEEDLPGEEDLGGHEEQFNPQPDAEGDPRLLNKVLPSVIAQVVFTPTAATGPDGAPPDPKQLAAQYVAMTSQILDLVEFHTCLGGMGELSKTTRLIIGVVALAGGVLLMRPKKPRTKRRPSADHNQSQQSERPTPTASGSRNEGASATT